MQPRLKTSKKWTAFPKEYSDQIKAVFEENFESFLDDEKIEVEGRIYSGEVMLRVGLIKPGRLRQSNFEASMDYSTKAKDALERIHNAVDAVASMMAEYFDNEEQGDLPLAWKEYPFQGKAVFLQYSTVNAELEKQADALLGELDDSLVVDKEAEDEDALSVAEIDPNLTPEDEEISDDDDDEDDDEEKSPRMFSGTSAKKESSSAPTTKTRKKLH